MREWLILGLVGCTISEEAFPERVADAICDRTEECTEVFEEESERESCETFWTNAAELLVDVGELGGEYDPAAGADCVSDIRSATCAEFNDFQIECPDLITAEE